MKRRSGFTLVEMVVAIAIAIIIGGAFTVVLVDRITQLEQDVEEYEVRLNKYDDSKGQVEGWLGAPVMNGTTVSQTSSTTTQATTLPTTTAAPPPPTTTAAPTTVAPTETSQVYILPQPNPNFSVSASVTSTWQSGGRTYIQYAFDIENITPGADVWNSMVIVVPEGTRVEGFWSGTYELEGTVLTLYPANWAERVHNRSRIEIAIQLSADGQIQITEFVVT